MRSCGIFSALLLAIIAVPTLAISILYNGIAQTILVSPSFVASLDPESMHARYHHTAPYLVQHALATAENPDAVGTTLFVDATTRATVQQILPQVLATHTITASPEQSMSAFEARLADGIMRTLSTMPQCTLEDESAISAILARNQLPAFDCAPTSPVLTQDIIDVATLVIDQASRSIMTGNLVFRSTTENIANQLNAIRTVAGQSIMFPATLIIMVVAFAVRSRRQLFGWASGILLTSAVVGVLLTLLAERSATPAIETMIVQQLTAYAGLLLPIVSAMNDSAFPLFLAWSTRVFLIMMGVGIVGMVIAIVLPKPVASMPRTSQPLGPQMASIGDGSTHRVKTDYETDALIADSSNTLQLPPGLDTSKLTFGRRMPKIPQPTQQITDMIPAGDHTSPIPVDGQTETLTHDTHTQELGPKEDSRATQRTDEHRF